MQQESSTEVLSFKKLLVSYLGLYIFLLQTESILKLLKWKKKINFPWELLPSNIIAAMLNCPLEHVHLDFSLFG